LATPFEPLADEQGQKTSTALPVEEISSKQGHGMSATAVTDAYLATAPIEQAPSAPAMATSILPPILLQPAAFVLAETGAKQDHAETVVAVEPSKAETALDNHLLSPAVERKPEAFGEILSPTADRLVPGSAEPADETLAAAALLLSTPMPERSQQVLPKLLATLETPRMIANLLTSEESHIVTQAIADAASNATLDKMINAMASFAANDGLINHKLNTSQTNGTAFLIAAGS
jgi:hypothetical protein